MHESKAVLVGSWRHSSMTNYYADEGYSDSECEVRIDGPTIVISSALDEGGYEIYKGREVSACHYELWQEGGNGKASLHRFPDDLVLEGSWKQDGNHGMWRIELSDEE